MTEPAVDLTIPVHSASRPIARAVGSVVDHTKVPVRVTVVAHNIDPELIRANLGAYADHASVRLLSLADGIRSPAGPMNHGLDNATAPLVSVMGSDDELEPSAIDSWVALHRVTNASAVLARILVRGAGIDPYPPVRLGRRTKGLDARKDRLAYRSAPLGVVDRRRYPDLRFTAGLASGEDLAYSATVWFTGRNLAYDLHGPAYVVNDDATDRVTFSSRAVADDFRFLDAIEATAWFPSLAASRRVALGVKVLRVHFFDAVLARLQSPEGILAHREGLLCVLDRIDAMAPGAIVLLARADRVVIDEVRSPRPDPEAIRTSLAARWNYRSAAALLPRNLLRAGHRQAPFRTLYAGLRARGAAQR